MKITKIKLSAIIFVSLSVSLISYWNYFEKNQENAFEKIILGDSIQKLIEFAGSPSYETDGTKWVEPQHTRSENQLIPGCKRELWYEAKLYPLPSKWSYCFNDQGKLVDKYHWVSW